MAVNLDDGGIYHGVFAVGIGIEGLKDLGENPAFNPTAVTLEHAVPVAKFGRQIAPWAAGTDNPQDGFDKETVIGCFAGVACLAAAQRLYFGPLGICQDISASHGTMLSGNYVCQQTLERWRIQPFTSREPTFAIKAFVLLAVFSSVFFDSLRLAKRAFLFSKALAPLKALQHKACGNF